MHGWVTVNMMYSLSIATLSGNCLSSGKSIIVAAAIETAVNNALLCVIPVHGYQSRC